MTIEQIQVSASQEATGKQKHVAFIGGYNIISEDRQFRLVTIEDSEHYPDVSDLQFSDLEVARDVGQLLSMAFEDLGHGASTYSLGNLGKAKLIHGRSGQCMLYRVDAQREIDGEAVAIVESKVQLVDVLSSFLRENNGN